MVMSGEEAQAAADVWKFIYGLIKCKAIKCALELGIPHILESNGGAPISLADLSSATGCHTTESLHRLMRFLIHHRIFKKTTTGGGVLHYTHTPLSRLLTRGRMGPLVLLRGAPATTWGGLCAEALRTGKHPDVAGSFEGDEDMWTDPDLGHHLDVFTDAMESHTRVVAAAMVDNYGALGFDGVGTLVDVGGRHGMALSILVKAFPWVSGITFDLPDIVAQAPPRDGVRFVGGSMFDYVPKADAVMLMWILHDWSDEACIDILKKCKEAVVEENGKVIIVEAVIDEDDDEDEYASARLSLDMLMMDAMPKGKERTYKEWVHLLDAAGFTTHHVINIKTDVSLIEAFP